MKNLYFLSIALLTAISSYGQVQITEIAYAQQGNNDGLGIEISGPAGTDISGWGITIYTSQSVYSTPIVFPSGSIIPNQLNGIGALFFATGGTLPTSNTSIALVSDASGTPSLISPASNNFLSYGPTSNTLSPTAGPASGNTSVYTGANTSKFASIQKTDTGWVVVSPRSTGNINSNLTTLSVTKNQIENFAMYPNPVSNGMLYMSSANNVNKQVDIYAINGQKVYSKNLQLEEKMNISNLNRGIYFVRIEEEGKIATRKLVVN